MFAFLARTCSRTTQDSAANRVNGAVPKDAIRFDWSFSQTARLTSTTSRGKAETESGSRGELDKFQVCCESCVMRLQQQQQRHGCLVKRRRNLDVCCCRLIWWHTMFRHSTWFASFHSDDTASMEDMPASVEPYQACPLRKQAHPVEYLSFVCHHSTGLLSQCSAMQSTLLKR